ncbi:MAG TPA: hypothetical protein VHE12_13265 [bacterium]|nr:hypothetical protein [bacterium]
MEKNHKKVEGGIIVAAKRAPRMARGPVVRSNPFGLIKLFLKGYLRKDHLVRQKKVADWLSVAPRVRMSQMAKWADLTRNAIVESATETFQASFKRDLSESEKVFMRVHVEEFVQKVGDDRGRRP